MVAMEFSVCDSFCHTHFIFVRKFLDFIFEKKKKREKSHWSIVLIWCVTCNHIPLPYQSKSVQENGDVMRMCSNMCFVVHHKYPRSLLCNFYHSLVFFYGFIYHHHRHKLCGAFELMLSHFGYAFSNKMMKLQPNTLFYEYLENVMVFTYAS